MLMLRWQHYDWLWFEILCWPVIGIHFVVPAADHPGLLQQRISTQDMLFHSHLPHLKFLPHGNYKKLEIVVT